MKPKRRKPVLCRKHGKNCYAVMLNEAGDGREVYLVGRFCEKCGAHLAPSGICLNGCHLSSESLNRFDMVMRSLSRERG